MEVSIKALITIKKPFNFSNFQEFDSLSHKDKLVYLLPSSLIGSYPFEKNNKLSANESALGMSKNAQKVIKKASDNISKYPDGKFKDLTSIISKKYNCNQNQVICGSGSDEIIQMLCQLFLNKGDEVVVPEFSFLMYRIYAKIVGAKVLFAKEVNFKVSVREILKKITRKTKIVFIANPNNPTATYLTKKEILELRNKMNKNIFTCG